MRKALYQHGDVMMFEAGEIPVGARKLSKKEIGKEFVIEKGEGTNTHVMVADIGDLCDMIDVYEHEGQMYVRAKAGKQMKVSIKHQEHSTKPVTEDCDKDIELEYDPSLNEERRVID